MSKKTTILYVDDEKINLMIFELNFQDKYNVIGVDNPTEGLKVLKNTSEISVVISDMRMPEMNGVQFIRKAKKKYPNIYYFILTGYDITEEIAEALDRKIVDFYFRKPFNMKEIDAAIQKKLKE